MVPSEIFHSRILVSERGGWRLAGFVQCRRWDVQPFPYVPAASLDDYLSGRRRRAAPKRLETWQNSYWALAAGITKSFCKDKLYISLDVNNILSTKLKRKRYAGTTPTIPSCGNLGDTEVCGWSFRSATGSTEMPKRAYRPCKRYEIRKKF